MLFEFVISFQLTDINRWTLGESLFIIPGYNPFNILWLSPTEYRESLLVSTGRLQTVSTSPSRRLVGSRPLVPGVDLQAQLTCMCQATPGSHPSDTLENRHHTDIQCPQSCQDRSPHSRVPNRLSVSFLGCLPYIPQQTGQCNISELPHRPTRGYCKGHILPPPEFPLQ